MRFQSLNFTNPEYSERRYYHIGSGKTNKWRAEQSHNLCPANNIHNQPYFKMRIPLQKLPGIPKS